ncbi:phosphomannomutase/phosphoglucomutase [Candidatus Micrarchaeota archaeon]|nr:phosphomannomutase/phosphoglucomutase [Candidatus Micrarchaeota archaeon]MBU1930873.1 phosphomannomutase/phosphoglucomutase [Candidatus Micrarchaeota archaeon]
MTIVSPQIFKPYDIRAIYPTDLDEKGAEQIGRAIAVFAKTQNVIVGRDVRLSSSSIAKALIKGITEQGATVTDIGLCSTPQLYFASATLPNEIAVMVTASHNPIEYNGFKICKKGAIALSGVRGLNQIRDLAVQGIFSQSAKKGTVTQHDLSQEYQQFFLRENPSFPIRTVVDVANSVGLFEAKVLEKVCSVIPLFFELDGNFPDHIGNPMKYETLKPLQEKVVLEKADLGISFDADADRVSFIDENGKLIPNDIVTALLARFFPNETVLFDIRSTKQIETEIKKVAGKPKRCRAGHVFIKEQMHELNAAFAGELSGHYYYRDVFFAESPLKTIFLLFSLLKKEQKTLSELVKPLQCLFQSGEINSKVSNQQETMQKIKGHFASQGAKLSFLDGITIEFSDWWFNLRPSNNEPLLRLNLEADSKETMEQKTKEVLSLIRS